MPGVLHQQVIARVLEVQTEDEGIALALAMCPPGETIELHEPECAIAVGGCTCVPRLITAPAHGRA
jgi:hypothetical protein